MSDQIPIIVPHPAEQLQAQVLVPAEEPAVQAALRMHHPGPAEAL